MAPPRATPASDPSADPPADPLVAVIEEAASFLATLWNREAEELPTSATQLHVLMIVERHRDINLSGLAAPLDGPGAGADPDAARGPGGAGHRAEPVPGSRGQERLCSGGARPVWTGLDPGGVPHRARGAR